MIWSLLIQDARLNIASNKTVQANTSIIQTVYCLSLQEFLIDKTRDSTIAKKLHISGTVNWRLSKWIICSWTTYNAPFSHIQLEKYCDLETRVRSYWVGSSSAKWKCWTKVLRKLQIWSKTWLKTELDLATETGSKNILRSNLGLSTFDKTRLKSRNLLRPNLSWTQKRSCCAMGYQAVITA